MTNMLAGVGALIVMGLVTAYIKYRQSKARRTRVYLDYYKSCKASQAARPEDDILRAYSTEAMQWSESQLRELGYKDKMPR